jgi:adenine-specific DNA methylase
MRKPRLLIEEWLPAAAIGVECMRERGSASALAPHTYLHVWWARRPLTASRAAVLGSLLPADFPRDVFERLLGFGRPSKELVELRRIMDSGKRLGGFGCDRAFKRGLRENDLDEAQAAAHKLFPHEIQVIDPMAGGGSIPLESARLGFRTFANEYNPVACTVLEATVDYPFRFGTKLAERTRYWGKRLHDRFVARVSKFFPRTVDKGFGLMERPDGYIFARTVPCPDTGFASPLIPDWHLLKPKDSEYRLWAEPVVDKIAGTWTVRIVNNDRSGKNTKPPEPTYSDGKGISLFTGLQISDDYIKGKAQAGEMGSSLYAIAVKEKTVLSFQPPTPDDLGALLKAERELKKLRSSWEKSNIIPIEKRVRGDCDRSYVYGLQNWADLFTPRQLLCFGTLVDELRSLRSEIVKVESEKLGEAILHVLAFGVDKLANWNSNLASWNAPFATARSVFDRHDFSFKATFCELAACTAGFGLDWAVQNVCDAFEQLAKLPKSNASKPVEIFLGSATNLPTISDKTITAVVIDPPYADNVQYAELADFFYVWLKRTQGHRRPEWFSSYLCDHTEEAVVNVSRHRDDNEPVKIAKAKANAFYEKLMRDTFKECRRILRDDGALTVMFTHKKQEAWESLFTSLVQACFTITATWPVKTESEHSLHQAKKNAAQSTVILVARKRDDEAEVGYFDDEMKREIRLTAQKAAERLQKEGLNPVDQLVGSFGPAMEVYSRYREVRTDTGDPVGVDRALDEASDAVTAFRIQQLSERGLQDVEPEGRFYLLCWDVLQAAEFRFNEAKLLGHAVGMDVDTLVVAGLVSKSGDKIMILSAKDRRRSKKLEREEIEQTLFGLMPTGKKKRVKKGDVLKVHPNDTHFRTALDACHALALRYSEAGGGNPGIGSARQLATQQGWKAGSPVARLMEGLVRAAPPALWHDNGKNSAASQYPEFRAWHAMVDPLFGITSPDWTQREPALELALEYKDQFDEEGSDEEEPE